MEQKKSNRNATKYIEINQKSQILWNFTDFTEMHIFFMEDGQFYVTCYGCEVVNYIAAWQLDLFVGSHGICYYSSFEATEVVQS